MHDQMQYWMPCMQRLQELVTYDDMVFSDTFRSNIILMEVVNWCIWLHPLIELVYSGVVYIYDITCVNFVINW